MHVVLHDVEEGDGLEERRVLPPAFRVDHGAPRVVEDPAPEDEEGCCRLAQTPLF
jgi:hypothetical protein